MSRSAIPCRSRRSSPTHFRDAPGTPTARSLARVWHLPEEALRRATPRSRRSAPRREARHLDRRAGGRRVADVLRVDGVHALEVVEVLEEDGRLDEPVEAGARRLEDRAQVREHLLGLLLDRRRPLSSLSPGRSESWPETKTKPPAAIACEYGAPWNGAGAASVRTTVLSLTWFLLGSVQAWARAAPSALKIASSTCWVSVPLSRRTCRTSPARSAKPLEEAPRDVGVEPADPRLASGRRSRRAAARRTTSSTTCASASADVSERRAVAARAGDAQRARRAPRRARRRRRRPRPAASPGSHLEREVEAGDLGEPPEQRVEHRQAGLDASPRRCRDTTFRCERLPPRSSRPSVQRLRRRRARSRAPSARRRSSIRS